MATFEKIDRAIITFDKNEIKDYNIAGGTYSATLTVNTLEGKQIDLKFDNNEDLQAFIENVIDCAIHMDWSLHYPSHWRNAQSPRVTLKNLIAWRSAFESQVQQPDADLV